MQKVEFDERIPTFRKKKFHSKRTIPLLDARSVVNKDGHCLSGRRFTVQTFQAQPPPPYVREELVDKNRLFVSNFKPKIGERYFIEIMEELGKAKVDEMIKGKKLIMLVFQSRPGSNLAC